jgi:hypothetical protein
MIDARVRTGLTALAVFYMESFVLLLDASCGGGAYKSYSDPAPGRK